MTQESFEYDREQNKINYEANIIGDIETLISVMENEDEFVYDRVSFFFSLFFEVLTWVRRLWICCSGNCRRLRA